MTEQGFKKGWLKLYRCLQEDVLWTEKRVFSKAEAWVEILMSVNYSTQRVLLGNQEFVCVRGQSMLSMESWAKKFGWDRFKTKRFFNYLVERGSLLFENMGKTSRITVLNFEKYQDLTGEELVEINAFESTEETTKKLSNDHKNAHQNQGLKLSKSDSYNANNFSNAHETHTERTLNAHETHTERTLNAHETHTIKERKEFKERKEGKEGREKGAPTEILSSQKSNHFLIKETQAELNALNEQLEKTRQSWQYGKVHLKNAKAQDVVYASQEANMAFSKIMKEVEKEVNENEVNLWFSRLSVVSYENNEFVLRYANEIVKNYISSSYPDLLNSCIRNVLGNSVGIKYEIGIKDANLAKQQQISNIETQLKQVEERAAAINKQIELKKLKLEALQNSGQHLLFSASPFVNKDFFILELKNKVNESSYKNARIDYGNYYEKAKNWAEVNGSTSSDWVSKIFGWVLSDLKKAV